MNYVELLDIIYYFSFYISLTAPTAAVATAAVATAADDDVAADRMLPPPRWLWCCCYDAAIIMMLHTNNELIIPKDGVGGILMREVVGGIDSRSCEKSSNRDV